MPKPGGGGSEPAWPRRGEVWMVNFNPTVGHEQAGRRPALVISVNAFNQCAAQLAVVMPLTSQARGIRSHVEVPKGEAGLKVTSFIKSEDIRSVSTRRLSRRLGVVSGATLDAVEVRLRMLLGL